MNKPNATSIILWLVYICLLGVLLPHTAWLFSRFEPGEEIGFVSWFAAFAFEAAIAVLTHKLAKHIEGSINHRNIFKRFSVRYMNSFSVGLVIAVGVSALANLAHAVEYGQPLKIFTEWNIAPEIYQLSFGAVLPVVSLLFARVLSNVSEAEQQPDENDDKIRQMQAKLRETEKKLRETERKAQETERQLKEYSGLISQSKADRIKTAHVLWPELPNRSVAIVSGSSPSHVSEVLASMNGKEK